MYYVFLTCQLARTNLVYFLVSKVANVGAQKSSMALTQSMGSLIVTCALGISKVVTASVFKHNEGFKCSEKQSMIMKYSGRLVVG